MSRELKINDKRIDLSDSTLIGVTYQANNIGELQNRQGTFTNTFQIPLTNNNKVALEWVHLMNSATNIPYRRLASTYFEEGIEIVSDGTAKVVGAYEKFIEAVVQSGNIDLARALGSITVGELYSNDSPFVWGINEAMDSRTGTEYYIFPLVDWRIDLNNFFNFPNIDVKQMLPCATMTGLFDRIEAYTGFTFAGSYLASDDHKNMILSPDEYTKDSEFADLEEKLATVTSFPLSFSASVTAPKFSGINSSLAAVEFDSFDPSEFNNGTVYFPPATGSGILTFKGQFDLTYTFIPEPGYVVPNDPRQFWYIVRIKDTLGAVLAEWHSEIYAEDVFTQDPLFALAFSISSGEVALVSGVGYFCEVDLFLNGRQSIDTVFSVVATNGTEFKVSPAESIIFGSEIYFRDLFRMKAVDVLKDVLNLRGLLIQTNGYTKEIQINFFQDLIDNIPIADDWSDKIDPRGNSMGFEFGKYAQKNWMRFKADTEVSNELGDYFFLVDNENLEAEKDVIKINHSATEQDNRYLGYNIPTVEAMDFVANKWQKPTYRILTLDSQQTNFDVDYTDGVTTTPQTSSIPFARFEGFELLIPEFYGALVGMLDQTKAIKLPVKMTPLDIQTLDFSIPKFLRIPALNIEGYFYLNLVDTYQKGIVFCEFVRL